MPETTRFLGIVIGMFYREELRQNRELARAGKPVSRVAPLEQVMDCHVTEARCVSGYKIWLRFRDGSEGVADLEGELLGPVFEPLCALDKFRRFRIDDVFHTLAWRNGADIAPEFLHARVHVAA